MVCTVKVVPLADPLPVIFSPAVTLMVVAPAVPEDVFVYWTYNVAGSDPVAATTCKTLNAILDDAPVNVAFTNVDVSVGKAFVVVSNLINSYFWLRLAPPGLTTAPSLKTLSPNLLIWVCKNVCICVSSLACNALPELKRILW